MLKGLLFGCILWALFVQVATSNISGTSDLTNDEGFDPIKSLLVNGQLSGEDVCDVTCWSCDTAGTVAPNHDRAVDSNGGYVIRNQIWDPESHHWNEFNPAEPIVTTAKDTFRTSFVVNQRYKNKWSEPELVISDWYPPLLSFLRAAAGDDFFRENPIVSVNDLLPHATKLRRKHTIITELLRSNYEFNMASKDQDLRDLGCLDAGETSASTKICEVYLTELVKHLGPFMSYMNHHFAPVERQLARMREYGQIDFALLPYYFEPGQKFMYYDDHSGRPDAFILESRYVESEWKGKQVLELYGFAWRFDGHGYSKRRVTREIEQFKGTRSIASLPAMELSPLFERMLEDRGRIYSSLVGVHHKEYEGQRVILDPKAYHSRSGYEREPEAVIEHLDDHDLFLLPPVIEGFNLANKVCPECQRLGRPCPADTCRTWQRFDVTKIKEVVFDDHAWDHLVLDADTKLLIEALVRVTDNNNTHHSIISDVISGKGGGLIAVLHGPPGTGKTLTAESIAEYLHRPMYMVGFSELSTTPEGLERNLRSILSLATAWDAVLLIDEADVFLEQRSLEQIERNALVSVALRLLEYHRGVLFLTTNRIGTFDEAFLSRFSIAIKYDELDHDGRLVVWKRFLELAQSGVTDSLITHGPETDLTAEVLSDLAHKPFNGRTIKNLVRTAQALAMSQREQLSLKHIKTVVRVQEKFFQEFGSTNDKYN